MQQVHTFTDASGRKFRATIEIPEDLRSIAFQLAVRARRHGKSSVKALDGEIKMTLEEVS